MNEQVSFTKIEAVITIVNATKKDKSKNVFNNIHFG